MTDGAKQGQRNLPTIASQRLGALYLGNNATSFLVWASRAERVDVKLMPRDASDRGEASSRYVPMQSIGGGYFFAEAEGVASGDLYLYRLNGERERPDPASRRQPLGVHGPSEVVSDAVRLSSRDGAGWDDPHWHGLPLVDYVLYELHVGTFTREGTFEAIIPHLDRLRDLGVTAIELLPIAQFPGERNWGYDGAYLFAAQHSYGGVEGLRKLVAACHARGMAIVLDVVYNHLGPEGNYLGEFAHYFTDRYKTPWGSALNFDGRHSDEVRRFFIENALYWTRDMGFDALRLDAVHAIVDESARPFLADLAAAVHESADEQNRRVYVIEESNKNDPRHIRSSDIGGYGLDGVWTDDFHHALHTVLTGERDGYYRDFGRLDQLAKSYREGFVFTGQTSVYRGRRHGASAVGVPAKRFVVCAQNHDQIGNRLAGERLSRLVSFDKQKLAAAAVILSPFVPMLFMGEEYGETAPFLYFVSHGDPDLVEAVRRGRREEFASFEWSDEFPDPQSVETFVRSRLNHELAAAPGHRELAAFYRRLLELRRENAALRHLALDCQEVTVWPKQQSLLVRRWCGETQTAMILCFGEVEAALSVPLPAGDWFVALDSDAPQWLGRGTAPESPIRSEGEAALRRPAASALLLTCDGGEI